MDFQEGLNEPGLYNWKAKVSTFDADHRRRLRLSSQLKLQQEIGELHLREMNLPYDKMCDEYGLVFVFTRINTVIYRRPEMQEDLFISTWCTGVKGIQFFRCYRFCDSMGNILIDSMASVATVDAVNHKLTRPSNVPTFKDFKYRPDINSTCEVPCKIIMPTEFDSIYERDIRNSDIDYNGHLNNTVYADLISDYMPERFSEKEITSYSINYISEAKSDDKLYVSVAEDKDIVYFLGKHGTEHCFDGMCKFGNV